MRKVKEQNRNVPFEQVKEEKRSYIGNGVVVMKTEASNEQHLKVELLLQPEPQSRESHSSYREGSESFRNVERNKLLMRVKKKKMRSSMTKTRS